MKNELHLEFVKLGNDRRKLTNQLLALLPEIYEKGIYLKYAASIVEYAGKFGGLSKGVVLKRLRLEKKLSDKPLLREAIKTEGLHKVALVANLATPENENVWVDKLKNMSKAAIQELSKEMRAGESVGLFENPACKAVPLKLKIELDEELTGLFLRLKKKFGGNLDNREVVKRVFELALDENSYIGERKISGEGKLAEQIFVPGDTFKPVTRYIPTKIKKIALQKSNNQCSYPNCNKPAEIFHHAERFAEKYSHESLITLCKIHHEFAHNGLIGKEER